MTDEPPPTAFAALLRQYRLKAGLTQEALAELAGLAPTAISALERGALCQHDRCARQGASAA
jgi:DNA-binding XRE family transcriptional regulator